jgi:hypothetical protein
MTNAALVPQSRCLDDVCSQRRHSGPPSKGPPITRISIAGNMGLRTVQPQDVEPVKRPGHRKEAFDQT